jgi:O-antigen/teichoic acid export membrane protein
MRSRQIFVNAITTIAQVIVSAAALFLMYRFLVHSIGVEQLGVWSLVLATTSVVTLANQGFSTSILKFVAQYCARGATDRACAVVETALVTLAIFLSAICVALHPIAHFVLKLVVPANLLGVAYVMLPYALVSLWFNVLGSVLLAALAGHELVSHRNYIVAAGSILYLLLAILFVPRSGLLGMAYAQTIQTAACWFGAWFLLRRQLPSLPFLPRRWSRDLFHEMRGYGLQFQFITMAQAAREPVTKALLAKFGGMAFTGLYDMASRWVFTFRELIVQANLVLVPTVANLRERSPRSIPAIYRESYKVVFFLAVPAFAFLTAVSPVVSRIWIGRYEPVFVTFVVLLAAGWLINILSNPAYVVDLGTGALKWVTIGCAATCVLNPALGYALGTRYGGVAVVAASVAALAIGYLAILVAYHLENRVAFSGLLPDHSLPIVGASALGLAICLLVFTRRAAIGHAPRSLPYAAAAFAALTLAGSMWLNPMRRRLVDWVFSQMAASA